MKFLQTSLQFIRLSYLYIVWKLFVSCRGAKTNIHGNTINASGVNCVVNGEGQQGSKGCIGETWNYTVVVAQWLTEVVSGLFVWLYTLVYVNHVLAYSPWTLYEIQSKIAWALWSNYQLRWKHFFLSKHGVLLPPVTLWTQASFFNMLAHQLWYLRNHSSSIDFSPLD